MGKMEEAMKSAWTGSEDLTLWTEKKSVSLNLKEHRQRYLEEIKYALRQLHEKQAVLFTRVGLATVTGEGANIIKSIKFGDERHKVIQMDNSSTSYPADESP